MPLYVPRIPAILFDTYDLPVAIHPSAPSSANYVTVSSGIGVVEKISDPGKNKIWRWTDPAGIQVSLPANVGTNATVYLFIATNRDSGPTAFFDVDSSAANRPSGYNYVRLLTAFVLVGGLIPPFSMSHNGWVTAGFPSTSIIPATTWLSTNITRCPTGSITSSVRLIVSPGLPPTATSNVLLLSSVNPVIYPQAAALVNTYAGGSFFNGTISALLNTTTGTNSNGSLQWEGTLDGGVIYYLRGANAYHNPPACYPTLRLEEYLVLPKYRGG